MNFNEILSQIEIDKGVFSPDNGTFELAKTALLSKGKFLEIGVGCGFISLLLYLSKFEGDCCDISGLAIECAKKNFIKFKIESKPFFSDLYENVNKKYDFIIFNPPSNIKEIETHRILNNIIKNKLPKKFSDILSFAYQTIYSKSRKNYLLSFINISKEYLNNNGFLLVNVLNSDVEFLLKKKYPFSVQIKAKSEKNKVLKINYNS